MKTNKSRLIFLLMIFVLGLLPNHPSVFPAEGKIPELEKSDTVFPDMEAVLKTTVYDRSGHVVTTRQLIHRSGYRVRFENLDSTSKDVWITDYDKKREFQIHHKDRIYFSRGIGRKAALHAARKGLIPIFKFSEVDILRIPITKVEISGHPCEMVLVVRRLKDREDSPSEYTLLWEALDMNRQPLRVAYNNSTQALLVLEYENIREEPIDPALLVPPEDYMHLSPF